MQIPEGDGAVSNSITITQGASFHATVLVTSGGIAVNLQGYTASAQMRRCPVDLSSGTPPDSPLITFTCIITPATGAIDLSLTAEQTAGVGVSGVWDLLLTSGSSKYRLPTGTATLLMGVTA